MQPAEQWLLTLADPEPAFLNFPRARLDADDLMLLCLNADLHGVLPAVWGKLEKLLAADAAQLLKPGQSRDGILAEFDPVRKRLAERAAMAMFLGAETKRLQTKLANGNAPAIALKGIDFASRLYARPALRLFVDMDLLISAEHWPAAAVVMEQAGYVPHETELKYATGYAERTWEHPSMPGAMVEVHDNLVNSPTVRRGVSVRLEDLPLEKDAEGISRPTAAGLLVIAAVHAAASHSFDKLQHLCDIAQIARQQRAGAIDEDSLRECAAKTGAGFCVMAGLDLAARTFKEPACEALSRRLNFPWPRWRTRWLVTPSVVVRSQGRRRAGLSWRRQMLRQMLKRRR